MISRVSPPPLFRSRGKGNDLRTWTASNAPSSAIQRLNLSSSLDTNALTRAKFKQSESLRQKIEELGGAEAVAGGAESVAPEASAEREGAGGGAASEMAWQTSGQSQPAETTGLQERAVSKEREEVQDCKTRSTRSVKAPGEYAPEENSDARSMVEARAIKEEGQRWEESGGQPW